MTGALPAILGAVIFLLVFGLGLLVIWRLCNRETVSRAQEAQRKYVITESEAEIFCATEGMVRIENHEWKPFGREAA